MEKSFFWLNAILLTSGVLCGAFHGTLSNSAHVQASADKQVSPRERFQTRQEARAFLQKNHDFYTRLNVRNIDYQKELTELVKYGVSYEKDNLYKLFLLFTQWGYDSPRSALEAADSLPFRDRDNCQSKIFEGWAEKNPEALAEFYKENRNSLYQSDALIACMKGWAETDINGALKFLSTLDLAEKKEGFEAILSSVSATTPERYGIIMAQLPGPALEDGDFLEKVMNRWLLLDPAKAMEWSGSLPSDKQELLAKYKGMEDLPPIASLCGQFDINSPELVSVLKQYPEAMQLEAWSSVLNNLQEKSGGMESIKWQVENVPLEIMEKLIASPFAAAIFPDSEEDQPILYEKILQETPTREDGSLTGISQAYVNKYGARLPEKVLTQLLERDNNQYSFMWCSPLMAAWIHDNPEEARPWIERRISSFSEEDKKSILNKLDEDKPVMSIKND